MFKKPLASMKNVFENLKRLLLVAWTTDKFLTVGYYASAGISAIFPIITSYIYKIFIDEIIKNQNISPTIPIIVIVVLGSRYLVSLIWDFFSWVLKETYFDYLLRYKLQNRLNTLFCEKLSNMDISKLEDPKIQDLITKAKDTLTWRPPDFLRAFSYVFNNLVAFVSTFILLLVYGIWIPILITLLGIPRLFIRAKMGQLQWSIWGSGAPEVRKLWHLQWILTHKNTIVESRVFQSSSSLIQRYKQTQDHLFSKNKEPLNRFVKIASLPQVAEMGILFVFAYFKLPDVLNGSMSVGEFSFFVELLSRLADSVGGMVGNFGWMYENNLYVNHLFDVLNVKNIVFDKENPIRIPHDPYPPTIEFKNVSFKYPGAPAKTLKNLNFIIKSGENVALVGKNGAGKTTIVKLLCRFYDADSGEILINGVNIKDVSRADWYTYIGTLFQEFVHYDFSVKDNIVMADPEHVDKNRLIEAARKSGALEFIDELPEKFDQQLGKEYEGGIELSQGQWQKIAITRAFYEGAPVLILDEPTSAIDAETEYEIFQNLEKFYKDKTLFLISHRFSTVRNADKIIVLDKGKIIEEGNHTSLISKKGVYKRMFEKQALGYK